MKRTHRSARSAALYVAPVALVLASVCVKAQSPVTENQSADDHKANTVDYYSRRLEGDFVVRTYHLANAQQQNDANEALIALRNILNPAVHIYLVASSNMIVLAAPPEQQQLAQNILSKLDVPKPTYRLVYTLTELEDGKRIGTQHYTLTAAEGQRVTLKQGSKIPLVTSGATSNNPQFQYIDVGMNFSVEADAAGNGVLLKSKVEQSSVPEEKTISGVSEPVIRQAVFEGSALVPFGKPFILGSTDVVGSNRRIDIEVLAEPINQNSTGR